MGPKLFGSCSKLLKNMYPPLCLLMKLMPLEPKGRSSFPLPDKKTKKRIFQIHTRRMTLADDVTLDDLIMAKDDLSGTDIKAICTEAGLMALWERRMKVTNEDFKKI
ncbi:26S proteasome regulatory subunit 4 [Lemmus lemmus]